MNPQEPSLAERSGSKGSGPAATNHNTAHSSRPSHVSPPPKPAKSNGRFRWSWIVALLVVGGIAYWVFHRRTSGQGPGGENSGPGPTGAVGAGTKAGIPPVPVIAGVVSNLDVPIFLDGLGTVQAFNTVVVRSRVDGQIIKIAFDEGQDVKAGDLLVQIDPAPYQAVFDQATAKKAQDSAQLANARVDLTRYEDLLTSDSITRQVYDTQKALLAQLEAAVAADQAAIEGARVNLDYTAVRAPIGGRVGIRQVDQGNIVRTTDANGIVVITQLRPITVLFTLPEQALSKLRTPPSSKPKVEEAFPVLAVSRENTNVLATGTLAVIDNQIDTTTGTIRLKATFPNENLQLWPGQFVNTRLRLEVQTNGVVVPASVVQRGPDGSFAFVINADDTVAMQNIKVIQIERGVALLEDGLKPGQRVVVDGQYKLQAGAKIRVVDPNANPSGGGAGIGRNAGETGAKGARTNSSGERRTGPRDSGPSNGDGRAPRANERTGQGASEKP